MTEKVKGFILANQNPKVKWKIDGCFFYNLNSIPDELLDKYVFSWQVNSWDGFVEISTGYHQ